MAATVLALALVAGCSVQTHDKNGNETASISFGDDNMADDNGSDTNSSGDDKTVSVNIPGFSAKVAVPGLDLDGADAKIDGIALYPGTRMKGVNVDAHDNGGAGDEGEGRVNMRFFAPASPEQILAYYKDAAKKDGWAEQSPADGQQFAATKTDEKGKIARLALSLAGAPGGSDGHLLIDGN
jgi:hypothetical protein